MSASYRIIHFVPDPFSGARVPVGALVDYGPGRSVRFAPAGHLPGPGCVGGRRMYSVMSMVSEMLGKHPVDQGVPPSISPMASIGPTQPVPAGVSDPLLWVQSFVLPRHIRDPEDQPQRAPAGPRRETVGYKFFEQWKVHPFVKKHFKPESLPGVLPKAATDIAHFVSGQNEILLMEPLIPSRSTFEDDLRHTSEQFLAWRQLFRQARTSRQPSFIAYVFGGPDAASAEAKRVLSQSAAEVVSVDVTYQRDQFLAAIRRVGATGSSQGSLPH